MLWRSVDTIQFGVDQEPIILTRITPAQERILAELKKGLPKQVLFALAAEVGVAEYAVEEFLASIAPILQQHNKPDTKIALQYAGNKQLADWLALRLGYELILPGEIFEANPVDSAIHLAKLSNLLIVCGHYQIAPEQAAAWLCDDMVQIPVVLSDQSVSVGPLLLPGATACHYCQYLQRTEQDKAWPALSAQLLGRQSPLTAAAILHYVPAEIVSQIHDLLTTNSSEFGKAKQFFMDGSSATRVYRQHSECYCQADRLQNVRLVA